MSKELVLTDENFDKEVIESDKPVLVDFWAAWCGPCKMIAASVEQIAEEYGGQLKVGKVNVDDNPNTAAKYGIMSIPTIMIFKEGKQVNQTIGVASKDALINLFTKYL